MIFSTVSVFEKPGANMEAEIWATPGWFKFSQCFLYENNPFISKLDMKVSKDGSYLEYLLDYHDESAYQAWHETWKHVHDITRASCFENLRKRGAIIQLYWPGTELGGNEIIIPYSEFVSKIPA